jgi:hypothetical protein
MEISNPRKRVYKTWNPTQNRCLHVFEVRSFRLISFNYFIQKINNLFCNCHRVRKGIC